MLFVDSNEQSVLNVRRILRCFEIRSGLKINFHMSCVVKVGKRSRSVDRWAELLRCKTASLSIMFLGLPLGGNPKSIRLWEPMLEKVRARLAPWKLRFISKAGRLVLIKSLLANLPTYFLSVFKIPKAVAMAIEKMQRDFFWGIKGILLKCMKLLMSDGGRIHFWKDLKVDGVLLAVVFPRIYALAANKTSMANEFGKWKGSVWEWHVTTRRQTLGWEESIWTNFLTELDQFRLRKSSPDSLIWTLTASACLLEDMRIWMDGWMLLCPVASSGRVWVLCVSNDYDYGPKDRLCESVHCPTGVNIVIESDSRSAISWVNGVRPGNIQLLDFLLEIKEIMIRLKPKISISFVARSGNAAADFLAKQGAASGLSQVAWG
ncbi:hypothetical protein Dsin_014358 [Dipteronia sinensis]|uniref:RNase H type-1 domain-containing protein n=1 Tax=Dipteronia sinensis TaxID=43782 RepID=A0AAE0E9R9_9ROSI|nr:hypothetical protein Dsin_014358 [Dipteronia sinensis]